MGKQVRTYAFERSDEALTIVFTHPDAVRGCDQNLCGIALLAVYATARDAIFQCKTKSSGLPGGPCVHRFHQSHRISTAEIGISCCSQNAVGIVGVKGHIGNPHTSPVLGAHDIPGFT